MDSAAGPRPFAAPPRRAASVFVGVLLVSLGVLFLLDSLNLVEARVFYGPTGRRSSWSGAPPGPSLQHAGSSSSAAWRWRKRTLANRLLGWDVAWDLLWPAAL